MKLQPNFHLECVRYYEAGNWLFSRLKISLRISTVDLPFGQGYETCVFRRNGDSEVIAHYDTLDEAIVGHYHYAKHFGFTNIKIN